MAIWLYISPNFHILHEWTFLGHKEFLKIYFPVLLVVTKGKIVKHVFVVLWGHSSRCFWYTLIFESVLCVWTRVNQVQVQSLPVHIFNKNIYIALNTSRTKYLFQNICAAYNIYEKLFRSTASSKLKLFN